MNTGPAQTFNVVTTTHSEQLYDAAAKGNYTKLHQLLIMGVSPDWYCPTNQLTPLYIAALKGKPSCVFLLLCYGADIEAPWQELNCTIVGFYTENPLLIRLFDRIYWDRDYKTCQSLLLSAQAAYTNRNENFVEIQSCVVISPGNEMSIFNA